MVFITTSFHSHTFGYLLLVSECEHMVCVVETTELLPNSLRRANELLLGIVVADSCSCLPCWEMSLTLRN
jgi:hypothetical protein